MSLAHPQQCMDSMLVDTTQITSSACADTCGNCWPSTQTATPRPNTRSFVGSIDGRVDVGVCRDLGCHLGSYLEQDSVSMSSSSIRLDSTYVVHLGIFLCNDGHCRDNTTRRKSQIHKTHTADPRIPEQRFMFASNFERHAWTCVHVHVGPQTNNTHDGELRLSQPRS